MGDNTTTGTLVIGLCVLALFALLLFACCPEVYTFIGVLLGL